MDHYAPAVAGSAGAVVGGLIAAVDPASVPGIILACGGLLTGAAAFFVPLVRIWADRRAADQTSKERRHHTADLLNTAMIEIELLKAAVRENQDTIGDLRSKLAEAGEAKG